MVTRSTRHLFALALGISLLLHLAFFASPVAWWSAFWAPAPVDDIVLPIDAALTPLSAPARSPQVAITRPAPSVESPPSPGVSAEPMPEATESAPQNITPPTAPPVTATPAPAPSRPQVRELPASLTLIYSVHIGEEGFKAGRSTYVWTRDNGRYTLASTTEATGIVALFMSGRIAQESQGEVGSEGLRPVLFTLKRGGRRQDQAVFDYAQQRLLLNGAEQPLRAGAQDLLSFPFHLALTVQTGQTYFILPVTDGRKLRGYRIAQPVVENHAGRTWWRLHAWRDGDGEIDVWFDPEQGGLPVQIRTLDSKGQVMQMRLEKASG